MLANRLKIGETIGIIAPSYLAKREGYARPIQVLKEMGFAVKEGKNLYADSYGYSATEQERADDLHDMVLDDEVRMILFGGGSVGNELLPYVDYDLIAAHPKLFVSFSDGTTLLNAIYARTGMMVYYGQTPKIFDDLRHYNYLQFVSHFAQGDAVRHVANSAWTTLNGGACEGILIGGYLQNFALMLGGKYFSYDSAREYLLFLEDHESYCSPAELSAYLSHIGQSDFMQNVSGLLFGHYSDNAFPEVSARLARFGRDNGIPVAACGDFGHGVNHAVLPIGRMAKLDADGHSLIYL